MNRRADVIVVGAGVVGLSAAYFAAREGAEVLVLERDRVGGGSSLQNAGLLVPSYVDPFPCPRNVTQGLTSLFDPASPVRLRFRLGGGFGRWLLCFLSTAYSPRRLTRISKTIARLHKEAAQVHHDLGALGGRKYELKRQGFLSLFLTHRLFEEGRERVKKCRTFGFGVEVLSRDEVRTKEPAVSPEVVGGLHFLDDAQLDPTSFLEWLAGELGRMGGRIETRIEVLGFRISGRRVSRVRTTGGEFAADQLVLAAGAWLPGLIRLLGRRVPIYPAKGYSLTFPRPQVCPARPLDLEEARVVVSPYARFIRLTSVLDLCGLDASFDVRWADRIPARAERYFPGLGGLEPSSIWQGLRPVSADGLPVVGRLEPFGNVYVGGGHDQKGMTLGPAAGLQLARLLAGQPPSPLETALSPRRFGRW